MKILFITPGKLPVPAVKGGAVENLIQMLIESSMLHKDNEISVIGVKDLVAEKEYSNYKNIKFYGVNTSSFIYKLLRGIRYVLNRIPYVYVGNEYIHRVIKFLKTNEKYYDIIIVENSPEYVLKLKHKYSNKIVLHLHNDFLNKEKINSNKILLLYDQVLCLSDYVSNRVRAINHDYKNIYTVYNGIDVNIFKEVEESRIVKYREKYGISKNDFVYIYSGRITQEKGVLELISAFNKVSLTEKNIKLLICGNLKDNKYIKEVKKKAELNKNIIFTGYINYSDLVYLYNVANVGVVPSIVEEGFGLIIVENMACGNPVIVSNSGGMPELVNNSVGIIFEKNNNFVDNLYHAMKKIRYQEFDKNTIIKYSHSYTKENYVSSFVKRLKGDNYENK